MKVHKMKQYNLIMYIGFNENFKVHKKKQKNNLGVFLLKRHYIEFIFVASIVFIYKKFQ